MKTVLAPGAPWPVYEKPKKKKYVYVPKPKPRQLPAELDFLKEAAEQIEEMRRKRNATH